MALSATDLATLDTAIASGALTVEIEGRRVTYRSIAELKEARKHVAEQIEQQNGSRTQRSTFRFTFGTQRGG